MWVERTQETVETGPGKMSLQQQLHMHEVRVKTFAGKFMMITFSPKVQGRGNCCRFESGDSTCCMTGPNFPILLRILLNSILRFVFVLELFDSVALSSILVAVILENEIRC